MRFTLKEIFAATAIVAMLLGCLMGLERACRVNSDSEAFEVLGVVHSPSWAPCAPNKSSSGVTAEPVPFTGKPQASYDNAIYQRLFSYSYDDNFGYPTFQVVCDVDAKFDDDWSKGIITPVVSGGGNGRANAVIHTYFDVANQCFTLRIRQGFHSPQTTKECKLTFDWNGEAFQLKDGE